MKPLRRHTSPTAVVVAAIALTTLAVREQRRIGRPWTDLIPEVVGGLALVVAALAVRHGRRANRCWWLLAAAGLAWFVGDFEHARNRDVAMTAFAFTGWQGWFLAWVVVAYPTGRLVSRRDRLLVVAIAALFAARTLSRLLLHVPPDVAGYGAQNRFTPVTDDRWWRHVEDGFAWTYAAAIVLVCASTIVRWSASSRPTRRLLAPVLFAACVLAVGVVYEYVVGWNASISRATDVRIDEVVRWAYVAVAAALAIGIRRLGRNRAAVIDLVAELGDDVPPARLGDALARALGDPSLELLEWSRDAACFVDRRGRPADVSTAGGRALTRIERRGQPVAGLSHDAALLEDPGLVNAVVAAVRLTMDNEHLQSELESQLAEVAASRARIVAAGDEERRRIERDLHDGAQQRLVTIALALRLAETRLGDAADPEVRDVLSQGVKDLNAAIDELRDLARGVHPAILGESGLVAAIESLVDRSPLDVALELAVDSEPPDPIAAAAYFAVAEALTNVTKHADATNVTVRIVDACGSLRVSVIDDGSGRADPTGGSGLRGIADRVAAVGGTLRVDSRPGSGTRFEVDLPCASL